MIASKQQTGPEAEANARKAYIEARIEEAAENLSRTSKTGITLEQARRIVRNVAREQIEREAEQAQQADRTRQLWMEDEPLVTEDLPLVRNGQGDSATEIRAEDVRPISLKREVLFWAGLAVVCLIGVRVLDWLVFGGSLFGGAN